MRRRVLGYRRLPIAQGALDEHGYFRHAHHRRHRILHVRVIHVMVVMTTATVMAMISNTLISERHGQHDEQCHDAGNGNRHHRGQLGHHGRYDGRVHQVAEKFRESESNV